MERLKGQKGLIIQAKIIEQAKRAHSLVMTFEIFHIYVEAL